MVPWMVPCNHAGPAFMYMQQAPCRIERTAFGDGGQELRLVLGIGQTGT